MSARLESLLDSGRRSECQRHDEEMAFATRTFTRAARMEPIRVSPKAPAKVRRFRASLRPLWREAEIFYLRWALREMPLMHPDLPRVVLRLRSLLDERQPEPIRAFVRWL
jgi:hypothetical protein